MRESLHLSMQLDTPSFVRERDNNINEVLLTAYMSSD
jgi:hypothetical protein